MSPVFVLSLALSRPVTSTMIGEPSSMLGPREIQTVLGLNVSDIVGSCCGAAERV
jgi:hypothetical protein